MKRSHTFTKLILLLLLLSLALISFSVMYWITMTYFQHTEQYTEQQTEQQTEQCAERDTEQHIERLPFGVWWWCNQDMEVQQLMNFAKAQGVNEIYWSTGFTQLHWCEETVVEFMLAAYENGIEVYYLTGDWPWIHNDDEFIRRLEAFFEWQESACEATRFAGVHLNIKPHQDPTWRNANANTRNELLQSYIDLKVRVTDRFGPMDWSIPFWWQAQEPYLVEYRGEMMYLYRASILEANRVFVMSYRSTAQDTYYVGQHHINFAREVERPIFLSALAHYGDENPEYDHVHYYFFGNEYMIHELAQLREIVDHPDLGIAVHEIVGWHQMWMQDISDRDLLMH